MATNSILAGLDVSAVPRGHSEAGTLSDYWALTKPEINFLIIITTTAGFWIGSANPFSHSGILLFHTLVGTLLVASGAAVLNQLIEMRFDAQMRRTARRPVASGRVEPAHALCFGVRLSVIGVAYLVFTTSALAAVLAVLTLLSYLFLYTPAKRITPWCTLSGAVPGAAPPLIGCAAATGHITAGAWVLFAIVFLWQFPHFMAIAWMYRQDYARAKYLVLPLGEKSGRFMAWQSVLPSLVLLPVTLSPQLLGRSSVTYIVGAFLVSSIFAYFAAQLALRQSNAAARRLLLASILYLPLLFGLIFVTERFQ
jgi:protoheme IX farnesyltransferase